MKKKMVDYIIMNQRKISILIDESTSLSKKATLIVVLRAYFEEEYPGEAYTCTLDLIELDGTDAEHLCCIF